MSGDAQSAARKHAVYADARHLHGPEDPGLETGDVAVVCTVKDGLEYVKTFVEYHLALGADHLIFLDNGSSDGTVEALAGYECVTVLQSTMPFKDHKFEMRQFLVERFCSGVWTLSLDVDELFDYPYSNVLDLESFLAYLSERDYTAVVAQLLDMFPEEPLRTGPEHPGNEEVFREEHHRFYDLSNIQTYHYTENPVFDSSNTISNENIKGINGGLYKTIFGHFPALTKHPLIFPDGELTPANGHIHRVSGARVADISCVIYHYKFLQRLYRHAVQAKKEGNYYNDSIAYKRVLDTLDRNPELEVTQSTSRRLESTNDLVDNGFLVVSEEYLRFLSERASGGEERALRAFRASDSKLLAESNLLRSRTRYAKKLNNDLKQKKEESANLEEENTELQRKEASLEKENKTLREEKAELQSKEADLKKRNSTLRNENDAIKSSHSWLILVNLGRAKHKLLSALRGHRS